MYLVLIMSNYEYENYESKILGLHNSVSVYRRTTPGLPFLIKTVQHTLDKLICDSAPSGGF